MMNEYKYFVLDEDDEVLSKQLLSIEEAFELLMSNWHIIERRKNFTTYTGSSRGGLHDRWQLVITDEKDIEVITKRLKTFFHVDRQAGPISKFGVKVFDHTHSHDHQRR